MSGSKEQYVPGVKRRVNRSGLVSTVCQVNRPVSTSHHASHVVLWRVSLDQGERGAGGPFRSSHPHRGTTLHLLRCHPSHHDDVLHRHQTGEQEHSRLGQWVIHIDISRASHRLMWRNKISSAVRVNIIITSKAFLFNVKCESLTKKKSWMCVCEQY